MAVVTVKSKAITNRDALPPVLNDASYSRAKVDEFIGVAAIASGDSVGSKYLVGEVPSNARPSEVLLSSPDIGTTTAADVGLYKNTKDGGAVVDADFFASAVALNAGALNQSSIMLESGVITVANMEKRIWELLGLTADPQITYDVALTLTGAADGAGSVALQVRFAQ